MSADLSKDSGVERPYVPSVQLLLGVISSNLFNQDNVFSSSTPVNIKGYAFVMGLSINAWRSF